MRPPMRMPLAPSCQAMTASRTSIRRGSGGGPSASSSGRGSNRQLPSPLPSVSSSSSTPASDSVAICSRPRSSGSRSTVTSTRAIRAISGSLPQAALAKVIFSADRVGGSRPPTVTAPSTATVRPVARCTAASSSGRQPFGSCAASHT